MELVLHIGSPKTGTTSLQETFKSCRKELAHHGWYYPPGESQRRDHNALLSHFRAGRYAHIRRWYDEQRKRAARKGCEQVLVSAENLFHIPGGIGIQDERCHATPAERVSEFIEVLGASDIRIVAYLRPQPEFAEALYQQRVTGNARFAGNFESFLPRIADAMNYEAAISAWERVLGGNRIQLRSYAALSGDVVEDFCQTVLCVPSHVLSKAPGRMNSRPSNEYIAVKRILNRIPKKEVEDYVYKKALENVFAQMSDLSYESMFDRRRVETMAAEYSLGNERLFERLGRGQSAPIIDPAAWNEHGSEAVLGIERALELMLSLNKELRTPKTRITGCLRAMAPRGGRLGTAARLLGGAIKRRGWMH